MYLHLKLLHFPYSLPFSHIFAQLRTHLNKYDNESVNGGGEGNAGKIGM